MNAKRKLSTEKIYYVPVNPEHVRNDVTIRHVKFVGEENDGVIRCRVLDDESGCSYTDFYIRAELYDTEDGARGAFKRKAIRKRAELEQRINELQTRKDNLKKWIK